MPSPFPVHIERLTDHFRDVRALVRIHELTAGSGPGYKHNVEVLNKSAIVLIVACWEAYVEDLAFCAFDRLLSEISDPKKWPKNVFMLATKEIAKSGAPTRLLELTGDGWVSLLKRHRDLLINNLHTPSPKAVDDLFNNLIGLPTLSSAWKWQRRSDESAKKKLLSLLDLRHSIVHKSVAPQKVFKWNVVESIDLINRLALTSSNKVNEYLSTRFDFKPWLRVLIGRA